MLWLCVRMAQWYLFVEVIHTLPAAILVGGGAWLAEAALRTAVSLVSHRYWIRCMLPESLRLIAENVMSYRCVELWGHTAERIPVVWISSLFWLLLCSVSAVAVFCLEARGISLWSCLARKGRRWSDWRKIF